MRSLKSMLLVLWHFHPFLWVTHFSIFYHHPFYHHFYSLKIANYRMREKKTFMATSGYYVVSKEVQNCMTRQSHFRHTCMYKKPVWEKQWNCNILVQILCIFLRYTTRILDLPSLLLAVMLS